MPKGVQYCDFANQEAMAAQIANNFTHWDSARVSWKEIVKEVREYIFATDTRSTSAGRLGWKNSTHVPKTCQLREILYTNLMAAVFPNTDSISWEGDDQSSQTKEKRQTIEAYMRNKLRQSGFNLELAKCLLDYLDYGNCFATVDYKVDKIKDGISGETHNGYIGPELVRISPEDIVFDPTAARFENTPKIIRSIKSLADLKIEIEDYPEKGYYADAFTKAVELRGKMSMASALGEVAKNSQFQVDGFSSWTDYWMSDRVELLDFYGDIYDKETDTLYKNYCITVVDRAYIIRKAPLDNWFGKAPFFHAGWRVRPDNLYAQGPFDNIIGMQYRIDHLENCKADGVDLIIHPVLKIKGSVEHFDYKPGAKIYTSEEGDVEFMHPDATILNLDTQIDRYSLLMEEMAGAPKQSIGQRTPGEKTAYEMQILENGANRVFINKASYFEETFMEPILNAMLEAARRNIGFAETIRIEDEDFNFEEFLTVTKEDITAVGKIRPIGARRFARNANLLQNLTQLSASPLYQDPAIAVHFSGKKMAELIENLLGIERLDLVSDNVRVIESIETQQMQSDGQQVLMEKGAMPNAVPGAPPQATGSAPNQPAMMTG